MGDGQKIENVSAKLGTLERRAAHLEGRLRDQPTGGAATFNREEVSALRAGIIALRKWRAEVEGLDEPILVLEDLVEAAASIAADEKPGSAYDRLRLAVKRARAVLAEWVEE